MAIYMIYIYIYICNHNKYCNNKNVTNTNANCFRFSDPFLISKKDSQGVISNIQ